MPIRRASAALALLLVAGPSLAAQDALSGVGSGTEVRAIEFRFEDGRSIREDSLRQQIAHTSRGALHGLRRVLSVLPFVPPVNPHPFDPVELQRDVVRLRQYYRRAGFLRAEVGYDVRYDAEPDLVEIAFMVREGPPLRTESLEFIANEGGPLRIAPELEGEWGEFVRRVERDTSRLSQTERLNLANATREWFRDRGYPFATASVSAALDTIANTAEVTVRVEPGARARIRAIEVEGNRSVEREHIVRQLSIRPGDWYSAREVQQSRLNLTQFDIVRLALTDVTSSSLDDSSVVVRFRVAESEPRLLHGDAGFASDGGVTAQGEWTHRSFLGGMRTLSLAGLAQTGVLALEDPPQRNYRIGARVFQPYVGHRRLSAAGGPYLEYRDDFRDRSWAVGFEGALVYAVTPLRSLSLGYSFARREILDYGFGADLRPDEYLPVLGLSRPGAVDTIPTSLRRSAVTLQGSYGIVDKITYPRRGYVLRPRLEVTLPDGINTSEYLLLELGGTAYLPFTSRIGLVVRGSAGRIYPFGESVQGLENESPFVSLLRLHDAVFTAGGTRDVRGWGSQILGPKIPEVRREIEGDQATYMAERYTPIGGLARLTSSIELRLPLPGFDEKWQSFVFLDAGRIWTPDRRFRIGNEALEQDDFFAATGAGVSYETIAGAVQFAVGYKLNPSALDLRDPDAVLGALANGEPISSVPTNSRRRLHLHFAIGTTF